MSWRIINKVIIVVGIVLTILTYAYQIYPWPFVLNPDYLKQIEKRTTWRQHGSIDPGVYKGNSMKGGNYNGNAATIIKEEGGITYFSNEGKTPYFFRKTDTINTYRNDTLGELIVFVAEDKAFQKYCSDPPLECGDRGTLTLIKIQ